MTLLNVGNELPAGGDADGDESKRLADEERLAIRQPQECVRYSTNMPERPSV
jgi:hypothetical protein